MVLVNGNLPYLMLGEISYFDEIEEDITLKQDPTAPFLLIFTSWTFAGCSVSTD